MPEEQPHAIRQSPPPRPERLRQPAPPTPWGLLILALVLIVAPIVMISQLAAHWRLDVVDDQMFAFFGWRIANGATMYLDMWDNKPPGIYWINALGFLISGGDYWGVILLCVLAVVLAHAAILGITGTIYYRSAAFATTALASFFITHAYLQGGTNRTETFLMPCELLAVFLYARGFARDVWWKWLVAGILCGAAFLFKQVGLAAWGAMGLHLLLLMVARRLSWRDGVRRGLLLAAGATLTVTVAAAYLLVRGSLGEALFATFGFNQYYFADNPDEAFGARYVQRHFLLQHAAPILVLPAILALSSVIHASLWAIAPRLRPHDVESMLAARKRSPMPAPLLLFTIWFCVAAYGAMLSPHAFRHYLLPVVPPLMLMCAHILNVILSEGGLLSRIAERGWVVVALVMMSYFVRDAFQWHLEELSRVYIDRRPEYVDGQWQVIPGDWEITGHYAADLTAPHQRIQAWGYQPGVYLHARRANVCRYSTTEKIGQLRDRPIAEQFRTEIHDALVANPPAAFVISETDWQWITHPEEFPENPPDWLGLWLAEFLPARYTLVYQIPGYKRMIWQRTDLVTLPPERTPVSIPVEHWPLAKLEPGG